MNVAQMLAHLQQQMGVADGTHVLHRTLFGRIVGSMVKSMIYNEKPFKTTHAYRQIVCNNPSPKRI
jgi:hypothetical protein